MNARADNPHLLPATGGGHPNGDEFVELLIVEGQSALHAVDKVRQPASQAILCMQGKLPNAKTRSRSRVLAHAQCQLLFATLNCGTQAQCDPTQLPYQQICLLVEGDADGKHVLWLQLLLFKHYLAPLLEHGLLRVIHSPIARVNTPNTGTENPKHDHYLWDEAEKRRYLDRVMVSDESTITAFKGIASLSSPELRFLLVDRNSRRERLVTP